jgi:hypothetical protein
LDELPYLSELKPSEKILRVLRLKNEAAKKRMEFYKFRKKQNDWIIAEGDKFESDNRAIYEFMHIEHIFAMIQSVESFHGAIASALLLVQFKESGLRKVIASLIEPRNLNNVRNLLDNESISIQNLCDMFVITNPEKLPAPLNARVGRLLLPTLDLIETMAIWSLKYWQAFKKTRNVYAHNYRFVFLEHFLNFKKNDIVDSIVGFLDNKTESLIEAVYVGPLQRIAMFELSMQIAQIEQWIYQNMRDFIRNDYKASLPLGLKYHSERAQNEYLAIRQSQGINLEWEPTPFIIPLKHKAQKVLHNDFLQANNKVTGRALIQIQRKTKWTERICRWLTKLCCS